MFAPKIRKHVEHTEEHDLIVLSQIMCVYNILLLVPVADAPGL